jgi:hypothetical protein
MFQDLYWVHVYWKPFSIKIPRENPALGFEAYLQLIADLFHCTFIELFFLRF